MRRGRGLRQDSQRAAAGPRRQDYVFEPNYQRIRHVRAVDFSHADHPIRLERLMQVEMSRDAHGGTVIGRLEIALAMLSTLR